MTVWQLISMQISMTCQNRNWTAQSGWYTGSARDELLIMLILNEVMKIPG